MERPVARVNYQREKRQKDLARQRKQEEKRQKKTQKDHGEGTAPEPEMDAHGEPIEPQEPEAEA
jgi:hypothetical protein